MKFLYIVIVVFLTSAPAFAQTTLQQEASAVMDRVMDDRFLTFNVENDLFGGGTDQNYTSGVRLSYFRLGADLPEFAYALDRVIPTFSINKTTSIYWSVGQNLYTPEDISAVAQNPDDRPWAGFLYASAGLATITDNHVDEIEASVGVIGPAALGEQTQKLVHKIVNSPTPRGWDNQLENEPGLILSWNRRFPSRYSFETLGLNASAEPHFGATIGNVYTYANSGVSFRLRPLAGKWQDDPVRVRPAMPGTGAFVVPAGVFAWHLFAGAEGRAVARNVFLDGNTFRDSHSVDKENFIFDANAGIAFTYGKARLSYALVYRSREFETQDDPSIFGTMSLGFRF